MKSIKMFAAVGLLLVAVLGAFASTRQTYSPVFFQNGSVCQPAFALIPCEVTTIPECEQALYETDEGSPLNRTEQIFAASNPAGTLCIQPYGLE